jgi:hypothetical protein
MAKRKRTPLAPLKVKYRGMAPGQSAYLRVKILSLTFHGTDRVTASVDVGSGVLTVPGERLVRSPTVD